LSKLDITSDFSDSWDVRGRRTPFFTWAWDAYSEATTAAFTDSQADNLAMHFCFLQFVMVANVVFLPPCCF